jgi:hypothetical protein
MAYDHEQKWPRNRKAFVAGSLSSLIVIFAGRGCDRGLIRLRSASFISIQNYALVQVANVYGILRLIHG